MASQAAAEKGCVLVVDDEPGICETLREVVEMGGCSAVLASSGAQALEILAELRPCLIIVDIMMPVMSGTQLLEAIEAEPALADLKVLVSTAAPERAPAGYPVVRKPIDIPVVWEWMRRSCHCAATKGVEII